MTKKKKLWIGIAAVVIVAVIVIINLMKDNTVVYSVQSEKVAKGEIVSQVTATGILAAKTDVKISADVPAKIMELPVKEGDMVKRGALLVRLDQTRYQAAVSQAEASLASALSSEKKAEASLIVAQQTYDRSKSLYAGKLISDENMVQVKSDLDVAKANLESSKYFTKQQSALLDQEKDALSKCTITTPIDGTITALNAEIGEIVMTGTMNNPGTVIMNVSDLSTIEVQVDVDETDVARVKLGQTAKISIDAFQDTTFKGVVTEVGNSAKLAGTSTDRSTNFEVKILLQDTIPGIKPGMTATADIVTDRRKDIFYVPISAVVMRPDDKDSSKTGKAGGKQAESSGGVVAATIDSASGKKDDKKEAKEFDGVFKVVNGEAIFVKVKTGISDQQHIQIVDGLTGDDEVITGSYKTLRTIKNKAKIKVVKELPKEENK